MLAVTLVHLVVTLGGLVVTLGYRSRIPVFPEKSARRRARHSSRKGRAAQTQSAERPDEPGPHRPTSTRI